MSEQVFRAHPDNARCFLYRGEPFKILTSAEHYGAVLNADFDFDVYLEEMRRTGQNATRLFTFYRELPHSIPDPGAQNTLAPRPEAAVLPWERVASGERAADGLGKFDLERWNAAYFERFRDFLRCCADSGIVCEVTLFCNPYDREKYDLFPCSPRSNVNGVGGDLEHPRTFMTLEAPSIVAFQERLVQKIVGELNEFDNLYYEICNEPAIADSEEKLVAWHAHLARVIRRAEEGLPRRHLIAANAHVMVETGATNVVRHDDLHYFENPDIDLVNYHYISRKEVADGLHFHKPPDKEAHAGRIWHFLRRRDAYPKPVVFDETFSGIVRGAAERYAVNRAEAWEMLLAGGAGYNNLDWSFAKDDESGAGAAPIGDGRGLDGRCLREWLHILRRVLNEFERASLMPAVGALPDAVSGYGYAALTDGEGRYVLYFADERLYRQEVCEINALEVEVAVAAGRYEVRTVDPKTGVREELPVLQSEGTAGLEIPAFVEDVAVLLDRAI